MDSPARPAGRRADHGAPAPQPPPHTIDLVAERVETGPATRPVRGRIGQASIPVGIRACVQDRAPTIGSGRGRGGAPRRDPPREAAQGRGDGDAGHRPGARRPWQGRPRRGDPGGLAGNLGTLVSGLAGGLGPSGFDQARAPLTEGGSFTEHSFANAAGARDYKLFVPSDARPNLPLVVMLHGCTQSPDDFAAGTGMNALAEAEGFLVAYPAQSGRANGQRCWNWFQPVDQGRDSGEAGIIAGLTRAIIADIGSTRPGSTSPACRRAARRR